MTRDITITIARPQFRCRHLPMRRPLSILISAMLSASPAVWALEPNALPTGGAVSAGSGSINTVGNQMTVQQDSHRLVTNWDSFNIGSNAGVQFVQPSSSSIALARVLSNEGSRIYGTLLANGQVFLVNPNGVYFAPGASVNVGGLVASTLNISNDDFLNGRNRFERVSGAAGEVLNEGRIEIADGGSVALIGAKVVNDGEIITRNGSVALAAGDQITLDFHGDQLLMLNVDKSALAAQLTNNGLIQADGGTVVMKARAKDALMDTVVNNAGIIRARSIGVKNGVVILDGGTDGVVRHSGAIVTSGLKAGEKGGTTKVLGDKVALLGSASIDARGDAGGGTVLIGGNYKGTGTEQNAMAAVMGSDAVILADAIKTGDGGKVILWADYATRFYGSISAKGGAQSGNGGFVETSGKEMLEAFGSVDAGTTNGTAGNWLLDPRNVTIAATTANGAFNNDSPNVFTPTADTATINVATINTSLNGGTSVTVTTGSTGTQAGNITLASGTTVSKTAGGNATLHLEAARDVIVNGTIVSTSDKLHVVLNSAVAGGAGSVSIGAGGQVITNGGNITIGGGADPATGSTLGGGTTNNGFRMQGGGTSQSTGALLSSGAGDIVINAAGSTASGMTLQSSGFSTILSSSGNITINAAAGGGTNGINMTTGNNTVSSLSGDITLNGQGTTGNGITMSSGGTNVITSESGSIMLRGTATSGTDLNIAPSTGTVRIGTHSGATASHDLSYTGSSSGTISLEGNTLNLAPTSTGSVQVASSGTLFIQPRTAPTTIEIGATPGGSNTLILNAAKLANLADGFSSIIIGRADGSGAINVGSAGFTDNLILRGGATNFNGALNMNANNLSVEAAGTITQAGALTVGGTTSLAAGSNDITLDNAGNDFIGSVQISAANASLTDADTLVLGAAAITGNLNINAGGQVSQTAALTIGGNFGVTTTHPAGNVNIDNTGAAATQLGNSLVGGDFVLTATGRHVTQAAGTEIDVAGNFTVNAATGTMQDANVVGGADNSQPGTTVIKQLGVVTLGDINAASNLIVSSLASSRSFAGSAIAGSAVTLTNTANKIGGQISVNTQAPAINAAGPAVANGIQQAANTTVTAAGNARFTATGGTINLSNAGNSIGSNLTAAAHSVTLSNTTVGGTLAISQTIGAALSNLNVAGNASVSNGGATSLNGTLAFGGNFTVGATGTGAIMLDGDTVINTEGTGRVSFGMMAGGTNNLTVQAHEVAFGGNWTGTGSYDLRANTVAKSVGVGGGAGTFNLSAAEMGFIGNASASQVAIGRDDGTGTVTLAGFAFDDALRIRGGNTSIASGTYTLDGGLDIVANGNISLPTGASVNINTSNDAVALAATGNVTFNQGAATNIDTGGAAITIAARRDASASGFVDLRNATLTSAGGNITVGGGADPGTGYAIGATVNGVRLGNTIINSGGGNVVINGQSDSSAGVRMGVSSATTIDAGAGDITIRGQSNSDAGIAMQSGTVSGGQMLSTTSGDITLAGASLSGDGMRIGSTAANTAITIQTGGGNINVSGTNGGGTGNGLNIGAGSVTLQTASSGRIALAGTAEGTGSGVRLFSSTSANTALTTSAGNVSVDGRSIKGSGVYFGPSTSLSGTTTAITTGSGNVTITGASSELYGIDLTASGTVDERGAANIDTVSGNITLAGTSDTNIGFRNNPISSGDTRISTVSGNIAISGVTGGPTAVSISPSALAENNGSATIFSTGAGNISIAGDQITLHGSRAFINGAGGTLTLQPTTAGTTIGFGSGTTGKLTFSDAELAAIGNGFSTIYVGNINAGAVSIGLSQPLANVVAVFSSDPVVTLPPFDLDSVQMLAARISAIENENFSATPQPDLDNAEGMAGEDGKTLMIADANGCARNTTGEATKCPK